MAMFLARPRPRGTSPHVVHVVHVCLSQCEAASRVFVGRLDLVPQACFARGAVRMSSRADRQCCVAAPRLDTVTRHTTL